MYTTKDIIQSNNLLIKTKNANIYDEYCINEGEIIGKGAYGRVHIASPKQHTTGLRLIKIIPRDFIGFPLTFYNEIENMRALSHENILNIDEIYKSEDNYYISTDFCRENLLELLARGYSENDLKHYFTMMLDAVEHCHNKKICHRDIRPESFLIQFSAKNTIIKLMDFFRSYKWVEEMKKEKKQEKMKNVMRMVSIFQYKTPYTAPQILMGEEDENCDIWSLGVILYISCTGDFPFKGQNDQQIGKQIIKGQYLQPKNVSHQLCDLISKILVPSEKRASIKEIKDHNWFKIKLSEEDLKVNLSKIMETGQYYRSKFEFLLALISAFHEEGMKQVQNWLEEKDEKKEGYVFANLLENLFKQTKQLSKKAEFFVQMCSYVHQGKLYYRQFFYYFRQNYEVFIKQNLIVFFKAIDINQEGRVPSDLLKNKIQEFFDTTGEMIKNHIEFCENKKEQSITLDEILNIQAHK